MEFRIADTFTGSLARLTGDEQKAVKTTAFDLQMNSAHPGLSFHKLDRARDRNFWSVRVSADIRLIVHRTPGSLLLCYVDHHDRAYDWAERRRLETHPKTGAAQFVEIRETVKEVVVPAYRHEEAPARPAPRKPLLFESRTDDELLGYGVPTEWLGDVRKADEDSLLTLADRLPAEAAEALLELATGGHPKARTIEPAPGSPFDHPDAQRRFRVVANAEELQQALEFPWEKWTVFLHPDQRELVERDFSGPARVAGSAGTGKTIVALHRAVFLARRHPDARVLLATFSETLAQALRTKLRRLIGGEPRLGERIEVESLSSLGMRLHRKLVGPAVLASREVLRKAISTAAAGVPGHSFTPQFLRTEWEQVVDAWQLSSWEAYREVVRTGRRTRLPETQRAGLWAIFEKVREQLVSAKVVTEASLLSALTSALTRQSRAVFDFAVVDESQDLTVAQLRFLAALGRHRPDALFFAGDLGQRIFQPPFSWKSLGVDVRGRSRTLRVNYRTSHQIRQQADRLLGPEVSDADGNVEKRTGTVSAFSGPPPTIATFKTLEAEIAAAAAWLSQQIEAGIPPFELGVFVRSPGQFERAERAAQKANVPYRMLDNTVEPQPGHLSISSMHLAKGLEFRSVAVIACDDEIVPLQERIQNVGDDADLQEVYDTERHLLYVACTRARDHLYVSGVEPASEFLEDLG
jgi:UvrD-like helicase C-terminal domain/AAA domain